MTPEQIAKARDDAERMRPLVEHILANHSGDSAAKDTTLALLLEHLHWQRQEGTRDAAETLRMIAKATNAKGGRTTAQTLYLAADAIDQLVAKNAATHKPY